MLGCRNASHFMSLLLACRRSVVRPNAVLSPQFISSDEALDRTLNKNVLTSKDRPFMPSSKLRR